MLRSLIIGTTVGSLAATMSLSQDAVPTHQTHGTLIDEAFKQAQADGADLKARIKLFEKRFNIPSSVTEDALASMDSARVRELLGISEGFVDAHSQGQGRYGGGLYVFASFSMPPPSLKQLFRDASSLNIPVVFNGFVENSVIETEKRVRATYKEGEETNGFLIDPTLFTRFDIQAVPTLVSTSANLDVCLSTDCSEDERPSHDRASGNVPLRYLLGIIAKGNSEDARPAREVLGIIQ